ncbi:hypothetical protein GGR57DRAFT_506280 [Xylariaceae sp. FL1272]|nr:hypothetical protein GGR57DRAFT_506280 [Xylariaceae sp. FL1272]
MDNGTKQPCADRLEMPECDCSLECWAKPKTDERTKISGGAEMFGLAQDIRHVGSQRMSVMSLPNELLREVLAEFRYYSREIIQNIRLTCHRFCDISSCFLLARVHVCLTTESLARFQEISHHPQLRYSPQSVTVNLAVYSSDVAHDAALAARICALVDAHLDYTRHYEDQVTLLEGQDVAKILAEDLHRMALARSLNFEHKQDRYIAEDYIDHCRAHRLPDRDR